MPKPTTFAEAVPVIVDLADKQYDLVHGDANTVVQTDNGPVPSAAKAIADLQAEYAAQDVVVTSLEARDDAQAAAGTAVAAANASLTNGQTYASVAAGLAGSADGQYFTVLGDGVYTSAARYQRISANAAVLYTATPSYAPLAAESGFSDVTIDPVSKRIVVAYLPGGKVRFYDIDLPSGSVSLATLESGLAAMMPASLAAESGYSDAIIDPVTRRVVIGFKTNGDAVVPGLTLGSGSVVPASLSADVRRLSVPQAADLIEAPPDLIRAALGSIAARTQQDGTAWQQFAPMPVPHLRGVNTTAVSIDFRRSSGLPIRGVRFAGAFDPGAYPSSVASGNHFYETGVTIGATSAVAAGMWTDYWKAASQVYNGVTVSLGDLIVSVGAGVPYQIQHSPGSGLTRYEGDWWLVSAPGVFKGITLAAGDRLTFLGNAGQGGLGKNPMWYLARPANGELYYRGEFDASAGAMPANPVQGDLWSVSVAGTIGGVTYAVNDYALFDGVWGRIPTEPVTTVAAGAMIPALKCYRCASEWEVRRTDKSATRVGVTAAVRHQSNMRRNTDVIMLRSDSMFGVPNIQPKMQVLLPDRTVVLSTSGGSTSREVLATQENEIYQGDPYRGAFNFLWHGQNNQPGVVGDANWGQIIDAAFRYVTLIGARDRRFCFLSILGQNNMSFDGTRIVVSQHENQFNKTGVLYALEQWYAAMFPGQWRSPRQILLAAAATSTIPDMRAPGMTEAQTAAQYGWIPYSYWNLVASFPFALKDLTHQGFWNTAALPSGGNANDAYLRTAGGTVGNLLVNVAGVWGEYAPDTTHQGSGVNQGGQYLAQALVDYLQSNSL